MKRSSISYFGILLISLICFTHFVQAQSHDNSVIISKTPKTVPVGKKWILEVGDNVEFQITRNCFDRSSLCSQYFANGVVLFISNGRLIPYYNVFEAKDSYLVAVDNMEETMNGYKGVVAGMGEVSKVDTEGYDLSQPIVFNEGENVAITKDCLIKITMKEVNK